MPTGGSSGLLLEGVRGFRQVLHVHGEIQVLVRKTPEEVLAARQALLEIFGPNGWLPQGWAAVMRPEEITVTESLYEDPADIRPRESPNHLIGDRWARIAAGTADCLSGLP